MTSRRPLAAALLFAGFALAACGSDKTIAGSSSGSTATTAGATTTIVTTTSSSMANSTGSSGTSSTGSGSTNSAGNQQVCAARDAFQQSLSDLRDINLGSGGLDAVKTAVDNVRQKGMDLADAAQANHKPESDALRSSLDQLGQATSNLSPSSLISGAQAITTAIGNVGKSADALLTSIKNECP